jgi:hypothetical protein
MNQNAIEPRLQVGGNNPPLWAILRDFVKEENFSATVTGYLADEFKAWPTTVLELLEKARSLPKEITSPEDRELFPPLIKQLRDVSAKLEAFHKAQKEPYLRGGQAVDQWFFSLMDKLARRQPRNNPGAADILLARLTAYDNEVLAKEQERRRVEAELLRQEAMKAEAARIKAENEAEEARLAADRARNPERKAEKEEIADRAQEAVAAANVQATVIHQQATEAYIGTLSKPADIMRNRGADGTLSTMAQEKYAEVTDRTKLDMAKLWPHIPLAALETALKAWAKSTDYREPMEGAAIGRRNKSMVR